MRHQQPKMNGKNIDLGKTGLTREINDLDMRYVKILCLSCVLDHEVAIIQQKWKFTINKNEIAKIKRQI